jgi:hypothetical protein
VHVSDCVANDNRAALLIDTQYKWTPGLDAIPGPEGIPVLKNFSFENVTGAGNKKAIAMVGMPERPVEGIVLKNVTLTGGPPGHIENARDVVIESVKLDGPLTIVNVTGTGLRSGQLARQGTEFSEPPLTSWDETVRRVRRHGLERQWFPRPACHACHGAGRRTVACPRHLR